MEGPKEGSYGKRQRGKDDRVGTLKQRIIHFEETIRGIIGEASALYSGLEGMSIDFECVSVQGKTRIKFNKIRYLGILITLSIKS